MPTTNPVPSQDPSDLLFNAGKLDEVLNGTGTSFTDRLGTARRTVAGMNADFDAQLADAESDLNVYRADAAASAAQALGYLNTIRTTSYGAYASDPATDPLGNPPNVGDEYFNTTSNLLKRFNGTTWQASDINTANLAAPSGSSLVGYDGQTVQDVLDGAKSLQDYAALRAYTGRAKRIYITGLQATAKPAGIAGVFQHDTTDTTSADNGGTIIVGADGRRWKRDFTGSAKVAWFEAVGDGVTLSRNQILAAFAAHSAIEFDEGSYYLGEFASSNDVMIPINKTVSVTSSGNVEFVARTASGTGDCFPVVFGLYGASFSKFGKFRFRDLNPDLDTSNRRGLKAYRFFADATSGSWGDVEIDSIYAKNCIAAMSFEGADAANRVRGVHVKQIFCDNTYYGVIAQNQGDGLIVDNLYGNNVRRIYFVYGCKSHKFNIYNRNLAGSTGTVNICRQVGGFDTEALDIRYVCRDGSLVETNHVLINHTDLLGGAIRGIRLDLDIDLPVSFRPVAFVNYDGGESNAASANIVDDVSIVGRFGSNAVAVRTVAAYASKGDISLEAFGAAIDAATLAAFSIRDATVSYTPAWTAAVTAPAIGSGTLSGKYTKRKTAVTAFINFLAGSGTTFGSGEWYFTLPFVPSDPCTAAVYAFDAGTAHRIGVARANAGDARLSIFSDGAASGWGSTSPITWAANDRIVITCAFLTNS